MFDLPVPCFLENDILRKKVEQVLSDAGLGTWTSSRVEDITQVPEEIGVIVLDERLLSRRRSGES